LIKDGWQKYILRKAAEDLLPGEIQWRADKVGYAAPLDLWLRQELRSWAEERLFAGPVRDLEDYDESQLRILWSRHQSGAENLSWPLWRWISLSEWLRMFAERRWQTAA
jgi:asparagine synthase (glutamine-hydrolysing)